ncbi:Leo1-like protein [Metschnikowia bicuspidata var. bicuspidata NRRL YB-4993]|uniref:Leo1-like protein n=1 Tax=Metschnikowia bicuspidata var. bicuspidata NRRL YB-4993 TaxID=869754 RepID=A0A1A0HK42_9ASCO|nr:Leo1-like protein [Metschnikowia bicuspidata var. bicuspidata NRRL YB-4993]OBA24549.1 Leo1-like protein [Metschnikowia bicuspidata var. bicuspidata NRRL YB-4993]
MSDTEISNRGGKEEDVEDLFGDDEDEDQTTSKIASQSQDENESEEDDRRVNNESDQDSQDEEEESEKQLKVADITIPRHAKSYKPEEDTYSIKMPVYLNVEAHPFDPNEFKEKVQQSAIERSKSSLDSAAMRSASISEKLLNENTIRWRYSNSGNDEIIKQSNAHFIQWDDGLLSLKIGKEIFDFRDLPLMDNFLARSHVEHEILQNDSVLTKSASLLPSSTATNTHRKLTQAVKNVQKKDKILNTLTNDDPMMKQRKADEDERKTLKMKRQLEQRRRLQEERLGKVDSPAPSRGSYSSAYERFERTYGDDEYDDEDDFVANDDEEPEMDEDEEEDGEGFDANDEEEAFDKGAERLKSLKSEGQFKYKSSTPDDNEDRRKRRRIIDSDDE